MMMKSSSDVEAKTTECGYCFGKRRIDKPETGEKDVEEIVKERYKLSFSSTKMRVDDFEKLLNNGFVRSGTNFY